MKRPKTKSSRPKRTAPRAKSATKPVDLAFIREQISNLVGNEAVGMVETTIEEVDKGRFLAMKLLFELIGLYPASGKVESPIADSLAKTLLRRLQLPEEELSSQTNVTKDCEAGYAPSPDDTVK
jgi:hypothetical protein